MSHHEPKTFLMRLIEHDHPGKTIEQILTDAYCRHGNERTAAEEIGITQQAFNAWKFRLGLADQFRAMKQKPKDNS